MPMDCPFCECNSIIDRVLVFARDDKFPVSEGHCLIVPKRHVETWFDMSKEEQAEAFELVDQVKVLLDDKYAPDGYNIGMNCGESAGQTIPHAHIHVIPRYKGDMDNPRGGVRGVIPDKQSY
ncbi:MAG: diadenosine tetraphosphate (Ap4A) HIT family hydrolase [Parvicella sp.]|jgi:diadenosine tetraphosphate (Ap4A) HIT family hydrolase